jgi:hypothetical protein
MNDRIRMSVEFMLESIAIWRVTVRLFGTKVLLAIVLRPSFL